MPKMTMLDMVQNILEAIDSDEVNSISDTQEALAVATIIEDTYNELVTNQEIPTHATILRVDALSDVSKPNYLKLPTDLDKLHYMKYNVSTDLTKKEFQELTYVTPVEFVEEVQGRFNDGSSVDLVEDFGGVTLPISNDRPPEIWTSFDDVHITTDAYDSSVESTLQSVNTIAFGVELKEFDKYNDDFVPALAANMFPLLLNEAKSMAFVNLKQSANNKVEKKIRQQRIRLQSNRSNFAERNKNDYKAYGRK